MLLRIHGFQKATPGANDPTTEEAFTDTNITSEGTIKDIVNLKENTWFMVRYIK